MLPSIAYLSFVLSLAAPTPKPPTFFVDSIYKYKIDYRDSAKPKLVSRQIFHSKRMDYEPEEVFEYTWVRELHKWILRYKRVYKYNSLGEVNAIYTQEYEGRDTSTSATFISREGSTVSTFIQRYNISEGDTSRWSERGVRYFDDQGRLVKLGILDSSDGQLFEFEKTEYSYLMPTTRVGISYFLNDTSNMMEQTSKEVVHYTDSSREAIRYDLSDSTDWQESYRSKLLFRPDRAHQKNFHTWERELGVRILEGKQTCRYDKKSSSITKTEFYPEHYVLFPGLCVGFITSDQDSLYHVSAQELYSGSDAKLLPVNYEVIYCRPEFFSSSQQYWSTDPTSFNTLHFGEEPLPDFIRD